MTKRQLRTREKQQRHAAVNAVCVHTFPGCPDVRLVGLHEPRPWYRRLFNAR